MENCTRLTHFNHSNQLVHAFVAQMQVHEIQMKLMVFNVNLSKIVWQTKMQLRIG